MYLGPWLYSTNPYICFHPCDILLSLLSLCPTFWNQELGYLAQYSFCSGLHWVFLVIGVSINFFVFSSYVKRMTLGLWDCTESIYYFGKVFIFLILLIHKYMVSFCISLVSQNFHCRGISFSLFWLFQIFLSDMN